MGYMTRYNLTQERNPVSAETLARIIKSNEDAAYSLAEDGSANDSNKWYEHEKDLCSMSLLAPDTLFKLHGEGEESGDIWDKYFVGGKMVHEIKLKAELPKPDYDKLVPDKGRVEREFVMDVPIITRAYTPKEAHMQILRVLTAAGIQFDDTAIGDQKAQPLK